MNRHEWLKYKNWAVVGASVKPESYGYKITERLLGEGYTVIPISNSHPSILDVKAYKSLKDYEGQIDVVDFVVNPAIGIQVLDEVIGMGIKRVLLQPGTSNDAIMSKAEENGIEVLQSCVLALLS